MPDPYPSDLVRGVGKILLFVAIIAFIFIARSC